MQRIGIGGEFGRFNGFLGKQPGFILCGRHRYSRHRWSSLLPLDSPGTTLTRSKSRTSSAVTIWYRGIGMNNDLLKVLQRKLEVYPCEYIDDYHLGSGFLIPVITAVRERSWQYSLPRGRLRSETRFVHIMAWSKGRLLAHVRRRLKAERAALEQAPPPTHRGVTGGLGDDGPS